MTNKCKLPTAITPAIESQCLSGRVTIRQKKPSSDKTTPGLCAVSSSRLRCDPSLRTSLHDLPLLFRCPLQRLTLAHTASLDPGGPESDLSGLSHFERGTTQRPIFR